MTSCQWIASGIDPTADDSCKCGEPAEGSPYCAEHRALAYLPKQALEKKYPAPRRELRSDYR